MRNSETQDPSEEFNKDLDKRQQILAEIKDSLQLASQGSKFAKKDWIKTLTEFQEYNSMTDDLISSLVKDIYLMVRAVAQSEVNIFALQTKVKTILHALSTKDVVSEEELRQIHDTVILPATLSQMGKGKEAEELLRSKDFTELASTDDQ